jgi:hypothetical protein
LHQRDQIVHHGLDVPLVIVDEKMMGDQSLVDLMMACPMTDALMKMTMGAKKDDR